MRSWPQDKNSIRVVADDNIDRLQVYAWRHAQPSSTNHPNASFEVKEIKSLGVKKFLCGQKLIDRLFQKSTARTKLFNFVKTYNEAQQVIFLPCLPAVNKRRCASIGQTIEAFGFYS